MSKHSKVTRYALVGTGARAFMFSDALLKIYKGTSSLVAICDVNPQRMDFHNEEYARKYGAPPVPTWLARDFDRMIAEAKNDPFALSLKDGGPLENLYLKAEKEDGYLRDQNVFGDGISIEDTMNLAIGYKNGAQLSYSLTAYSPWEGYRIAFNGTKGRLELDELENSYISAGNSHIGDGLSQSQRLTVFPHWKKPWHVEIPEGVGGHGGGDLLLLEDLFGSGDKKDPLNRAASHLDGARSILTGIAANLSFATGQPVQLDQLLKLRVGTAGVATGARVAE